MILSPDLLMIVKGSYDWNPDRLYWAWRCVMAELIKSEGPIVFMVGLPGAGKTTWIAQNQQPGVVYLDATLSRRRERRDLLRQILGPSDFSCNPPARLGRIVTAVYIDTPLGICLERNAQRPPNRQVPEKSIRAMARSLAAVPPSVEEGFYDMLQIKTPAIPTGE